MRRFAIASVRVVEGFSKTNRINFINFNSTNTLNVLRRGFSAEDAADNTKVLRNIGISAHIDSGKTTLTERILFYTGRIRDIHEVRGKDGVGAKMDSMELEREKGITIQSAATHTRWHENHINIIDTPGHVDFTIEVERALRVLDGAILVLCGVSGVQSQTSTVDRQMKRYSVPRIAFINKLDRAGANPMKAIDQMRKKLFLNAAALQVPIGLEADLKGVVDLLKMKALYFQGEKGETITEEEIPEEYKAQAESMRAHLIEQVAEVDDPLAEMFLEEQTPTMEDLKGAIRRATIANKFVPVMMGSAFKNKGVQPLLDAVIDYLPSPPEKTNTALDLANNEAVVELKSDPKLPLVALAFKLEEGRFGQLTYVRVYQGTLSKGDVIMHVQSGKKVKVPRLVRMHSNEMEDVNSIGPGEICAIFGLECSSGDTFANLGSNMSMTSMHVPEPVMSLAIAPKDRNANSNFSKALNRFTKEDPTFRVGFDPETSQTIISGMGELHLEIYLERMRREYSVDCQSGAPKVNFRETITAKADFDYLHKKQTGGQGQFGRVIGFVEPLHGESYSCERVFQNNMVGNNIPSNYVPAIQKGFEDACLEGSLSGHPMVGLKFVIVDGASHAVDSSELAFRIAAKNAVRQAQANASPVILEPLMSLEVVAPEEFQGTVVGGLNRRKGVIHASETEHGHVTVHAEVPLSNMFGYSTELRSATQGKGEFSMEYARHAPVPRNVQEEMQKQYLKKKSTDSKE